MSKKKFTMKTVDELKKIDATIDAWVNQSGNKTTQTKPEEEVTRITIELPVYLHRRIKKICAIEGVFIKDKINQVLLQNFPET